MLRATVRGCVGLQRGKRVVQNQSHTLLALTAGRAAAAAAAAVDVCVQVASSWLQAVR